ncbi:unnamed protein product, partial [Didymodactylos carnosus]
MEQKLVAYFRPQPPLPVVDSQEERESQQASLPSPSLDQPKHRSTSDTSMSSSLLCQMPAELLLYNIFPYVTFVDLCHLSQVNTFLHNLLEAAADEASADHLWTKCIKDEMLENFIERDIDVSYVVSKKEALKATIRVCANERFLEMKERIFHAFGGGQSHPELWPDNQEMLLTGEWSSYLHDTDRLSQHQKLMDEEKRILTVKPHYYPRSTKRGTEYAAEEYRKLLITVANHQKEDTLSSATAADTAPKEREFHNEKSKFQYLFMKRKEEVNPWTQTMSVRCGGCTGRSRTDYNWQLYCRYITVYPTTNPIKREHEKDKLCIYYEHGQLNPVAQMDNHSRYLVTELEKPKGDSAWPCL